MIFGRFRGASLCLLIVLLLLAGCKPKPVISKPIQPYTPAAGAVGFDILPMGGSDGSHEWLATYTDGDRTTKFRINLDPPTTVEQEGVSVSAGHGTLVAEAESDPLPLLDNLKKALQAKQMPRKILRVDALPFDYVVLRKNQSRSTDGKLGENPTGDWSTAKLRLANGHGEVLLNIDAVAHQAEFAIEDAKYGDSVLAELAKVL